MIFRPKIIDTLKQYDREQFVKDLWAGVIVGIVALPLPAPVWPSLDLDTIKNLFAPAFTIALLGGIESLLSAMVADGMIGGNYRSNTELIAQGTANMLSSLFGGMPATGAIARTATNIKNGGRSPSLVPIIDATGLRVLREVCKESTHRGTKLILTEVYSNQVMRELKESRLLFTIGKANITDNLMEAIQRGSNVMAENNMINPETAAQLSGGGPPIGPGKSF